MKSPAGVLWGQGQANFFQECLGSGEFARVASMCCCRLCKFSFGKDLFPLKSSSQFQCTNLKSQAEARPWSWSWPHFRVTSDFMFLTGAQRCELTAARRSCQNSNKPLDLSSSCRNNGIKKPAASPSRVAQLVGASSKV